MMRRWGRGAVPLLAAALTPALVAGCSPVGMAVGAGAVAATAASEERGLGGVVDDAAIQAEINRLWLEHDLDLLRRVDMTVREGQVLLTGAVAAPRTRVDAVRLAWRARGVKAVINEIEIDEGATVVDQAADAAIAQKIEARLLFDRKVRSINYTVDVVNGTVYLLGVAQSREALDRAIAYARDTRGVRRVVSHVRIKGEDAPAGTGADPSAPML
ncbi:BON domain-containing protein [Roseospira goensis]|uniref:Osmotically-inducible protein OsmY n=1 Tax=Roseospira goensis TaxID=391922 RepID=A0A7W6WKW5_9PROT|nr:BON domain-containing protein [Roseospira goensis]MBB4286485.1 osmotically-inducible protein OsmY [Roseospira goensis]